MRWRAAPLGLLLVAWGAASATAWGRARSIATPLAVARATVADVLDGSLPLDLAATAARALLGATAAVALGGAVGVSLGARPSTLRAAEPALDLVRSVPPILVYPLLLLALGYSELSRAAAITFGAFGAVAVPVAEALARMPVERRDAARLAGLRGVALARGLLLPEATPALVTGARLALSQGLVVAVVTEMLITPAHGLGARALAALQEYRPERLWQVMLAAGALSAAFTAGARAIEALALPDSAREPPGGG